VVLQSGTPALDAVSQIIPGRFHQIETDTGLDLGAVPSPLQSSIVAGEIRGRLRIPASMPPWANTLFDGLPPLRRAVHMILADRRPAGATLLLESARNQPRSRRQAVIWGALLLGDSAKTGEVLLQGSGDQRPEVRLLAIEKARELGGSVAPALAKRALRDPDSQVRRAALRTLRSADPGKALSLLWPMIWDADLRVQEDALKQLETIARARPLPVLDMLLEKWDRDARVRTGGSAEKAKDALARLMQQLLGGNPQQVAAHLVGRLTDAGQRPERTEMVLQWLTSTADQLDSDRIQPALTRLTADRNLLVRAAALSLQARFDQPEVAQARLAQLARTTQPAAQAAAMRRAAAVGLGLIKAPLNRDRFNLLKALARDRDAGVRSAAVRSLLQIGQLGLLEVARAMKAGPPDLAQAALQEVCRPSMSTRTVTTILGVAWKLKRQNMRARALACAQSLADASLRLRLWLADQAAKDKDPLVRRAGAAAAAAALRDGGVQFTRLAKLYLGDRDPELRTSLLLAIRERPPSSPAFLFDLVERTVRDSEPKVRIASARAVVAVAPSSAAAVRALEKLLRDPDARVQRAGVDAAGELRGGAQALDASLAALVATAEKTEDALAAVRVAGKLKLIDALRRGGMHGDGEVRATALEAIVPHIEPREALPILDAAMRDPKPEVRELALRAIGRIELRLGKRAAELLWQGTFAPEGSQRQTAFGSLGRLQGSGAPRALELLRMAARHPSEDRRRMAIAALGQAVHRSPAATEALVAAVEDPSHDVRGEARVALASFLAHSGLNELWQLLLASERTSLERRLAVAALALHGRRHGTFELGKRVASLPSETPLVTAIAARLALALSRSSEPPEPLLTWFYGW
jgi:HEAT repeat protein